MKIQIMHDSKYGNGNQVAQTFAEQFPDDAVSIHHYRDCKPEKLIQDLPDFLIIGSAVRMFMISQTSMRWVKKLCKLMRKQNAEIRFVSCFITHMREIEKIKKSVDGFFNLLKYERHFLHLYPTYFLAPVVEIQGPLKEGVIENARARGVALEKWSEKYLLLI